MEKAQREFNTLRTNDTHTLHTLKNRRDEMKTDEINTKTHRMKLLAEAGGNLAIGVLALAGASLLVLALPFAAIYDAVSSFFDETCCKAYDFKL